MISSSPWWQILLDTPGGVLVATPAVLVQALIPGHVRVSKEGRTSSQFQIPLIFSRSSVSLSTWQFLAELCLCLTLSCHHTGNSAWSLILQMHQIGIIVLDEAHHCEGEHPYALLIKEFWGRPPLTPNAASSSAKSPMAFARPMAPELGAREDDWQEEGAEADSSTVATGSDCYPPPSWSTNVRPKLLGLTASPVQVRRPCNDTSMSSVLLYIGPTHLCQSSLIMMIVRLLLLNHAALSHLIPQVLDRNGSAAPGPCSLESLLQVSSDVGSFILGLLQ